MANNLDIALREDGFNQVTKRYGFSRDPETGDVAFDETQAYAVMTAAMCERNAYWADPNLGSEMHTLESLTSRSVSQAEAFLADAEQPLVDEGLILEPVVSSAAQSDENGNRLVNQITWSTPSGEQITRSVGGG